MAEPMFVFSLTKPDADALVKQVSRALETRTQLKSRKEHPTLWKATDKLNDYAQKGENAKKKRHVPWTGILCLVLGVFLFVPGLMAPREMTGALVIGALGIFAGLWSLKRQSPSKSKSRDPFDRPARQLLESLQGGAQVHFTEEGMTLLPRDVPPASVSYDKIELVVEAEDVYLLFLLRSTFVLQKADLTEGDANDFGNFLSSKVQLVPCIEQSLTE